MGQNTSTDRPIPLKRRADLRIAEIPCHGVAYYVMKDAVSLKYARLSYEQYRLWQLLDGELSLEQLRERLTKEFPAWRPTHRETLSQISELHQQGLVYSTRPGQAGQLLNEASKTWWKGFRGRVMNPLSIRFSGLDPDRWLEWLLPLFGWLFTGWGFLLVASFVVTSWVALGLNWQIFRRDLPAFDQFFGWPNLLWMWGVLAVTKVLHEFGHGLSCKKFGGECHQMGVMLLVFSPCLYCDVSDSWMLKSKWKRMAIGAAGMYIESIISAFAIFGILLTAPGFTHYLCLNTFFVTAVTTIAFNANPLMRLDGYFILSDWLEEPNLRPRADKKRSEWLQHLCLGIEPPQTFELQGKARNWFVAFAIASWAYGIFVYASILLFLYVMLKPYDLQSIGVAIAVTSLAMLLSKNLWSVWKTMSTPRMKPLSRWRLAVTGTVVAGLVAALFYVPIPWYRPAEALLEPVGARQVYSATSGTIVKVHVQPGDYVRQGDLLLELTDPMKDLKRLELVMKAETQKAAILTSAAIDEPASEAVARVSLENYLAQLAELDRNRAQLKVLAPIDGWVVAPDRKSPITLEAMEARLADWHGTPLDRRNEGAFLQEQTHLLTIAPKKEQQATLYIDQADLHDVKLGQRVRVKFEHLVDQTYEGKVTQLAWSELSTVPAAMSMKQGGRLTTVTDGEGKEKLVEAVYRATVEFEEQPAAVRPGLRGQARFIISERTAVQWGWRAIRRLFSFSV